MMIRSARYPSTGDTIHADPVAMISPERRTFSLFRSDDIEMKGIVSSMRNGLLFYDNDREVFLHRPVFSDILSSSFTALQIGVINEFSRICTWAEFGKFLLKIDKTLLIDQFRQYQTSEQGVESQKDLFYIRAKDFCQREGIRLTDEELRAPDSLRKLAIAIASMNALKCSLFVSSVPDIQLAHPDPALCQVQTQKRASRWLNVAGRENNIPLELSENLNNMERNSAVRQIVAKYMDTVDKWEGSPLMKTEDGHILSRADIEDFLTGCATVYCPSPLGWTPRLRYAFYCPNEFRDEPIDVKIELIAELERIISETCGFDVKLLYIPENNCLILESLTETSGGAEIPCTFENGQNAEIEILNLGTSQIAGLAQVVQTARKMSAPDLFPTHIENARRVIQELTLNEDMYVKENSNMEYWDRMGQTTHEDRRLGEEDNPSL